MAQGLSSPELKAGNDRADELASRGAAVHQLSDAISTLVHIVDARTWLIQKRLLAIVKIALERHEKIPREPIPKANALDKDIEECGHIVVQSDDGWHDCMACGQRWHKRDRRKIIGMGHCQANQLWGHVGVDPDVPKLVKRGSGIVWAGHMLHRTHVMAWKRGLVICMRCGSLSQGKRVGHLCEECPGRPRSSWGKGCLKAFREGGHPICLLYTSPSPRDKRQSRMPSSA